MIALAARLELVFLIGWLVSSDLKRAGGLR
jgi:hypothetical protein